MSHVQFQKAFVLLLLVALSGLFLAMLRPFWLVIALAALFAALTKPLHRRLAQRLGNRPRLAAVAALLLVLLLGILPLALLVGAVTAEAIKISQAVKPWIQRQLSSPAEFGETLKRLPFVEHLMPYRETILLRAGELVGRLSGFLIESLSSVTVMTAQFLFLFFLFLYALFFFWLDGERMLSWILAHLPLNRVDAERMLARFTAVTRATLRGIAAIGFLQGALVGAAFAVVEIPSAVFWGTIAAVCSLVPGIGTALVWLPAVMVLASGGKMAQALGLLAFCSLVVTSVDNFLRPRLVGQDTRLHELLVLFGTLGGIWMFGAAGILLGPIVAALVVTVWEIYASVFREELNGVESSGRPAAEPPPEEDEGAGSRGVRG